MWVILSGFGEVPVPSSRYLGKKLPIGDATVRREKDDATVKLTYFEGILPKVEPTAAKASGTANQLIGEEPKNGKSVAISQNQASFILLAICILTNH